MRILSTTGAGVRHGLGAVVEAGLVVAIAGVLVFGAAVVGRTEPAGAADVFAAKGGNSGAGAESWIQVDQPASRAAVNLGYGAAFNALYATRAAYPWGYAECRANSTTIVDPSNPPSSDVIWGEYRSSFGDGSHIGTFDLIDPNGHWIGGGADCTLTLLYMQGNRWVTAASSTFTVAP